jgi:hypothetical protein
MHGRGLVMILVLGVALAGAALAQVRDERLTRQLLQGLNPGERGSAEALSPAEAARRAQSEHGGQVLSVEPFRRGYRVKLLVDGEVRFVEVQP